MSSIDERIVQMRFDNQQFESGVKTSLNTLDRLKKSLNLEEAAKNVANLQKVGNNFSLSGMAAGVETIANKFSTLGIIGVTALQNITTAAMHAGVQIAKSLTIDPVMTGLTEYETKMNAITTILTNTQSKGTTLDDVNKALSELNTYADQTIYNFAEMTRNIGTFTAAGVDLDTSVKAIKGIANLAAGSGSTAVQASTAMYQLSQAIAAGRVSLQDWNSVVNAGMGGELFQNALKETAKQMGIVVDESVSFRESISTMGGKESWLTSDVLVKTLESFADNETLVKAATQVKTITQLFDTMKESVQSGWAQSWEYIIGDRDQAIETLTAVSDGFNDIIGPSTEARNEMLRFWNQNGGRDALIKSMSNSFQALADILGPVGKGFRDVFPAMTGERLVEITEKIKEVTDSFQISDETTDKLQRTFRGAFSAVDLFRKGLSTILSPVTKLGGGLKSMAGFLLDVTASIGDFFTELNQSSSTNEFLTTTSNALGSFLGAVGDTVTVFTDKIGGVTGLISSFGKGILDILDMVMDGAGTAIEWLSENLSAGDIFAGLAGGGVLLTAKKISGFLDEITGSIKNLFGVGDTAKTISDNFSSVMDSVRDTLDSFTSTIKTGALLTIAASVGILAISLNKISEIKPDKLAKALLGMTVMLAQLNLSFRSMLKSLSKWPSKGLLGASISMMALAGAINIMASALQKMSGLNLTQIAQGLGAVAVMLGELTLFLKVTNLKNASLKGSAALVVIAGAIRLLSDVIVEFSGMSWEEIGKGLTTLGGALIGLSAAIKIMSGSKINLRTSVAILAIAESTQILAEALGEFSGMSWEEIGRGLTAMGGALAELTITLGVLSKVGGGGALLGGAGVFVAAQALDEIAAALTELGQLSWEEIGKGLTAMGGALAEIGVVTGALGKLTGFSGILGGGAILIAVQSLDEIANTLEQIGGLSWSEIGKGLAGMGGALAEIGIVTGALGKLAGFSGLLGGGSLVIAVQALEPIADTLERIGGLTWDEIKKGLVGMGAALAEVAVVTGALGGLTGLSGLMGGGAILLGVQGLGTLADALAKFGAMSWEEIGHGLVGMGGALVELGVVAGLLGALSPLAMLGSGALLLGVQGLGDLADALKKFGEMDWDEIGRGLAAMAGAMGATALGGLLNTLSGFGADAIATVAEPLGTLADSLKKWKGVSVPPDLSWQMAGLATGVQQFTFAGFGAGSLEKAAPALGELASAVNKWKNVSIPDGLNTGLRDLADGIKAFTWTFVAGFSMDVVRGPLSKLPGAVKKWNDVTIPSGIGAGLEELADGIGAFTWSFAAGWSIDSILDPLKSLASAVKGWNGVSIPNGIGTSLSGLANGLSSFSALSGYSIDFSGIGSGLRSLGSAAISLSGINFASISSGLTSFANSIRSIPTQISNVSNSIRSSVSGIAAAISSQNGVIASSFTRMMSGGVVAVQVSSSRLTTSGRTAAINFATALSSSLASQTGHARSTIVTLFNTMITSALQIINTSKSKMNSGGRSLIQMFINGMNSQKSSVQRTAASIASAASGRIDDYNGSYYSAGRNAIQGFINGMNSRRGSAIGTAASIAASALASAKSRLGIASPSKEFEEIGMYSDQGMVNGLLALAGRVRNAGASVGRSAMAGVQAELTNLTNVLNTDTDFTPTIRPVMDLSAVASGMSTMQSMFWNDSVFYPNFSGRNAQMAASAIDQNRMPKQVRDYGPDILDAFNTLGDRVDALGNRIAQMKMVLDTGAAVGGMSQKMDQKLGQMANYKGRNI